jgi:hypothetical protein
MKLIRLSFAVLAMCAAGSGGALAAGGMGGEFLPKNLKKPSADATTDAQLDAARNDKKAAKFQPVPGKAAPLGYDLVSMSTFISDKDIYTLVPKAAVLHVPEARSASVGDAPGKNFSNWPEFLAARRGWVTSFEVTLAQARGEAPISPEQIEAFKKGSSVVVAVYRGGPISVLPLQPKDAAGKPVVASPPAKR